LARKLEKMGSGGKIVRLGIDPSGMFHALTWDYGGEFATANGTKITANSPAAIKALQWELSFYKRLGAKNIAAFQSGEGQYASPANPFFRGQLAMTYDGEWLQAFVQRYAPQLRYGVAELPYPDGMATDPRDDVARWRPLGCAQRGQEPAGGDGVHQVAGQHDV
jgi:multiple sugar transport system substrate-binding protein